MSTNMTTPQIYIQQLDAFGNAFIPVPSATPAFIGYTAQTSYNGNNFPGRVLNDFGRLAPKVQYQLT